MDLCTLVFKIPDQTVPDIVLTEQYVRSNGVVGVGVVLPIVVISLLFFTFIVVNSRITKKYGN
jgi:ATP/ADP translocase